MIRDINDSMPKIPNMKWGALFNWHLSDAEVKQLVRKPPFPKDHKFHTVDRLDGDIIIDGHLIRRSDESKLT